MTEQRYAWNTSTTVRIVAEWCGGCGIPYGLPEGFLDERRRDHKSWTCPNGCSRHYPRGKSDEQKLREAAVRETALRDQLSAAIREGETTRRALLRDRHRFANGVCPCCTRSFDNVRRHMLSQHPGFDVASVEQGVRSECSCGRAFDTLHGLHVHQGRQRVAGWDAPSASRRAAHLTVVGS